VIGVATRLRKRKRESFNDMLGLGAEKLALTGVCSGLIDFVKYASEFSYRNEKQRENEGSLG
jgi:hypothetical protein